MPSGPVLPPGITLTGSTQGPRGRSITASRPCAPGDIIATFTPSPESPSLAIPDSPHLSQACSHCLAAAPSRASDRKLRACTACKTVSYCDPACQRADWPTHKAECKVFQRMRARGLGVLPTPSRALVQVLLRPQLHAALADLQGHVNAFQRDAKTRSDLELQAMAALHYMGRDVNALSMNSAVEILCKLQVNAFNRLDEDIGQSGLFMNPGLAMVNHSCVPNAYVQFIGSAAILHASQEIGEGEEVEISYIECNLHKSHRQEALETRYQFRCSCARCRDDLDVYQVCQKHSHLELNTFSLVTDLLRLRHPPIRTFLNSNKMLQDTVEEIYPSCSGALLDDSSEDKETQLRQRWRATKELRKAGLFAIEPLNQALVEANIYFTEREKFAYSLAIACFLALHTNPYTAPMPFAPQRVKGMLIVAKLLANTAPINSTTEKVAETRPLETRILHALSEMDQATICQVVLGFVIHYNRVGYSSEGRVYQEAMELLSDLEAAPGRDAEQALVKAFFRNPKGAEQSLFLNTVVLNPISTLSQLAMDVMETEFGR
ncbi:SET domain-containing protein [Xylariaceae sp. FL0016]|nr:SET domain-containing protein [Xylariaceae sp. FL0016]